MPDKHVPKVALARQMRKAMTTPEYLLWERLKLRRGDGVVFHRQHAFGPFILDFYCAKARLCVEVDGALHDSERDERRDTWLLAQKIEVYRVPAADVYKNADAVADGIWLKTDELIRNKGK